MTNKKKNFYEILNLKEDCNNDEIKKSFIKMSKEYHPDKNMSVEYSHDKFLDISEAYETLKNPLKRKQYDDYLLNKSRLVHDSCNPFGSGRSYGFSSSAHSSSSANFFNKFILKLSLLPKGIMIATFVFIMLCSAGAEFHFLRSNYESKKALLENKSFMAGLIVNHAREQARIYGKEEQLRRLKEGLLGRYDANEILDKYLKDNSPEPKHK